MAGCKPQITFDKELFFPGEEITGKAWIHTAKDYTCRKVTIKFLARTVCSWDKSSKGNDGHAENQNSHLKANLNHVEMVHEVWAAENEENNFPAGEYDWNFSFELPKDCYPSFESRFGHIRYFVELEMDVPHFIDTVVAKAVTVSPTVDLLQYSNAREIVRSQTEEQLVLCRCIKWKQGKVHFTINLPKTGYVPGERIAVTSLIENHGSKPIKTVKCALIRKAFLQSDPEQVGKPIVRKNAKGFDDINGKIDTTEFGSIEEIVSIPAGSDRELNFELAIPSVVSTIRNNPYLNVEYSVRVSANVGSSLYKEVHGEAQIIIGNVPLLTPGNSDIPPHTFEPSARGEFDTKCWINRFYDGVFVPKFPVYSHLPVYKN